MFLQFNPDDIAVAFSTNADVATTAAGVVHANSAACMPISAGADPVSFGLSAAFTRYQVGFGTICDNGFVKTHEGNGKLPEQVTGVHTTDVKGSSRVGSTLFGSD
ncbi:hypothetical protein NONO_c16130 [Nocardia nova SH22a]|uniref:Uncharacterized protein n=1 Tax=Nocardia nova SH22a TaxID=1415166 RepID=W5TBA8_9NOCA|nr:PE domain-containing protein [Nocardia nova]AHH16414.1 hypothetical protein NONO_c16130 [Nocardia nova SH22a]